MANINKLLFDRLQGAIERENKKIAREVKALYKTMTVMQVSEKLGIGQRAVQGYLGEAIRNPGTRI